MLLETFGMGMTITNNLTNIEGRCFLSAALQPEAYYKQSRTYNINITIHINMNTNINVNSNVTSMYQYYYYDYDYHYYY